MTKGGEETGTALDKVLPLDLDKLPSLDLKNGPSVDLTHLYQWHNGKAWMKESRFVHSLRAHEFRHQAYDAWRAFHLGDKATVEKFLRDLFDHWDSFTERWQSAAREALVVELEKGWMRPGDDRPPWLHQEAPNPKGALATRVAYETKTILKEREQQDKFAERLYDVEEPSTGTSDLDQSINTKHDERAQVLKEIATSGRGVSRDRARIALEGLEEGLDEKEVRDRLGDAAWRAFKTTARTARKKDEKKFA